MAYVASITGHRPEKISNWQYVEHQLGLAMQDQQTHVVIQGMAAGVDLLSARVAFGLHIPYVCARPWAGHKPRKCDEVEYRKVLSHAQSIVNVNDSEKYPGPWVYQKRNEWMVDRADFTIAVWDGTSGDTANCVEYALQNEVPVWRINPATHETGWYAP